MALPRQRSFDDLGTPLIDVPFCILDLETTGVDPAVDRIVELSVLRVEPDGSRTVKTRRINPERPIPPEASAVHGITDADVAGSPTFRQVAKGLLEMLDGADLTGITPVRELFVSDAFHKTFIALESASAVGAATASTPSDTSAATILIDELSCARRASSRSASGTGP